MGRTQEISEGNVARALLKEFQSSRTWVTHSPHLKVNVQVARSNIEWFCSMPLLPDTFNCRTRSPSQDKRCFYMFLSCCVPFYIDLECKILDWQARPLSKQSLSFVLSVWYPCCHDHDTLITLIYFDPQERFRKLARERRNQRSREKERQDESKRAAETVRRAASKTLETFEIMLALVQIPRRDQCASRTWEFMKSQKLVSPLDHFSNRSLELGPPDLILNGRTLDG